MLDNQHESRSENINILPDPQDNHFPLRRKKRRRFWPFLLVGLIIAFGSLEYKVFPTSDEMGNNQDHSVSLISRLRQLLSSEDKKITGEKEGRVNILILGMGGSGHEGPYLTDTNILLSYNPDDHTLAMLSLPRDLAVYIPQIGFRKINSVNAVGESEAPGYGGELTRLVVSELVGLKIPYFVRVDFQAFQQIIDDLNGIRVEVPKSFTDSEYPTLDYKYQTISFQAGSQEMDGETALKFARSRHGCCGEGGDFARARRQQLIISAVKQKMLREKGFLDPKFLIKLYQNYQNNIDSNLNVGQVLKLAKWLTNIDDSKISTFVLNNSPEGQLEDIIGADGAYMLQPRGGDYELIRSVAAHMMETPPEKLDEQNNNEGAIAQTSSTVGVIVLNGTYINGFASRMAQDLKQKGFHVVRIGNAPLRDYQQNYIYDTSAGKHAATISALIETLDAITATEIPSWLKQQLDSPDSNLLDDQTEIVIVLGAMSS